MKFLNLNRIGGLLIIIGLGLFAYIFFPAAQAEVEYTAKKVLTPTPYPLTPLSLEFGIVIPKIGANAPVIVNVDPYNPLEYQVALTKGIAHAKGTKWFLFAHSAGNPLEANRYNAVFYLINKLMPGDEIDLYVKGQKYNYKATENKIVEAKEVQYMTENKDGRTLTLMTCWPPGTTLKRLLVIAKL